MFNAIKLRRGRDQFSPTPFGMQSMPLGIHPRPSAVKPQHRSLACFALFTCLCLPASISAAQAPPKNAATPATIEEDALLDGLLDLLTDPEPSTAQESALDGSSPATPPVPQITPEDLGLDGEDLGEQAENPLAAVRQSMLIAAEYLKQGSAASETQLLQQNIVQRLDELINEIESAQKRQKQSQQSSSSSAGEAQEPSQATPSAPPQTSPSSNSSASPAEQDDGTDPNTDPNTEPSVGNQPGETGRAAVGDVPRALQENVWGQLPERVRKQLQSRRVEQFLPSHRQQIEAYFRALLHE